MQSLDQHGTNTQLDAKGNKVTTEVVIGDVKSNVAAEVKTDVKALYQDEFYQTTILVCFLIVVQKNTATKQRQVIVAQVYI